MTVFLKVLIGLALLILLYIGRLIYLVQVTGPAIGFGDPSVLSACPGDRPNCVCSCNQEEKFAIPAIAIPLSGLGIEATMQKLQQAAMNIPRGQIIYRSPDRLDVTYQSQLFGFKDDVSFHIDPRRGVIDVKSTSRVGYSDLGVNRKRLEAIRAQFGQP